MSRVFIRNLIAGIVTGSALLAQTPAAAPPLPAFEVASIRPAPPIDPAKVAQGKLHVGMNVDGAQVDIGFYDLKTLIVTAFKVKAYQISGPDWLGTQRFDILAKIPEGVSKDQVPEMLQSLLAERFKMTYHRETKEQSVTALVVGKNGPKLKESPPDKPEAAPAPTDDKAMTVGTPDGPVKVTTDNKGVVMKGGKMGTAHMTMGPNGMHMEAEKMTMADFADMLSQFAGHTVVDLTGLKGNYQVAFDISMQDIQNVARRAGVAMPGPGAGEGASNSPAADAASDPGSSMLTTLEALGLKLENRKTPVDLIVIDHIEKTPTEN